MLESKEIFQRAVHDCMVELYKKAQPSADWDQLVQNYKDGKYPKDVKIYERYYLSAEELKYIVNKYISAYGYEEKWKDYLEILEEWFRKGGSKEVVERNPEGGHNKWYEKIPPIKEELEKICGDKTDKVLKLIEYYYTSCRDFYRFDRNESSFNYAIYLGASPCTNPKTVIDYWKSQGVDLKIEERNPLLLWERDYYGDEFEEVMENEYGENWKETWDKEWQEEKEKNKKY